MVSATPDADNLGRLLKLRDLQILAAVVQWGSMARAASHLAMSQPAVSESISNLEAVLRVRLLDRSTRGAEPTPYAEALLRRSRVAFDELRQGIREIEFLADPTVGEVRVVCGDTIAAGLLPGVIDRLSRRYPRIVVRVVQSTTGTVELRELRERTVDLALVRLPGSVVDDDLDAEMLFDDPHRVVVGARSPWARRRRVTLAALANAPWIFPANPVIRDVIAEAFAACGQNPPQETVSSNSILLRNHLLATGRFVTVLPHSVVRYNARQWSLKALAIDLPVKTRSVAILTLKHRSLSPVVQRFIENVRVVAKAVSAGSALQAANP
jgi:DNA-binding transcriptional LysR family regulator